MKFDYRIQELKKKIENANTDLSSLRETQKSQDEMVLYNFITMS